MARSARALGKFQRPPPRYRWTPARSRVWRSAGRASRRSRRPALASTRARGAQARSAFRLAPPPRDGSPDGSYGTPRTAASPEARRFRRSARKRSAERMSLVESDPSVLRLSSRAGKTGEAVTASEGVAASPVTRLRAVVRGCRRRGGIGERAERRSGRVPVSGVGLACAQPWSRGEAGRP